MEPKDRIAMIIVVGLVTWGILAIGGAILRNKSLTEGGGEFFVAIGGALVASVVTYLASKNNGKK